MNTLDIKKQATIKYEEKKQIIIPEYFYIGYVSLLAQYLQSGLFSFFVSLFLSSFAHGYVVCSKKLIEGEKIDYHDSLVGVLEFTRVTPLYLIKKLVSVLVALVILFPFMLLSNFQLPAFSMDLLSSLGNSFIQTEFFIPYSEVYMIISNPTVLLIGIFLAAAMYILMNALFVLAPYVIEEDDYSWYEAITISIRIMKNHLIDYVKVYLHFVLGHFMYWAITTLLINIVSPIHEILSLSIFVFSLILYIDLFKGKFELAKYIFYKNVRNKELFI